MESPTNMGPDYQRRFHDVFPALAREQRVAFLPFLLQGVAGRPELNQRDGIHPTAEGARQIADLLWPVLEPMVASGHPMIALRGVSKTVTSGSAPLTILHPLDLERGRRPVPGGHRAVRQREVHAARPDRGPRRAVSRARS